MKKQTLIGGIAFSLGVSALACSAAFAAPVNTAFRDNEFYKCVANSLGLLSSTNLTDEQLASIEQLNCDNFEEGDDPDYPHYNVTDLTGITKLTGLKSISLRGASIKTADFGLNTNLKDINLGGSSVENVVLPSSAEQVVLSDSTGEGLLVNSVAATNLKLYSLSRSKIKGINIEKNTKLEKLYLTDTTGLDELSVAYNPNLETLETEGCNTVFRTKAVLFDEENLTFDISDLNFIKRIDSDQDVYTYDSSTKKLTIVKPEAVNGYITIDGKRLYVPLNVSTDETTGTPATANTTAGSTNTTTGSTNTTTGTGTATTAATTTGTSTTGTATTGADNKKTDEKKTDKSDEEVPNTSTGKVEEPKKEEKKEEKKENPDTSTESKLILGISILGIAVMGVAVKAIMSARAKRA